MTKSDFYRRNLPHWQPARAEYFVTFRLKGTIPKAVVKKIQHQFEQDDTKNDSDEKLRRIFRKYEAILDSGNYGPHWLQNEDVAGIVSEALTYRDESEYDLYAFYIMSNHVHVVFRLLECNTEFPVTDIFKKLKSYTALKTNKFLDRQGPFWQSESYDRVIRDQKELENTIFYVLNNPVKAGLVNKWQDWKHNYCKSQFSES